MQRRKRLTSLVTGSLLWLVERSGWQTRSLSLQPTPVDPNSEPHYQTPSLIPNRGLELVVDPHQQQKRGGFQQPDDDIGSQRFSMFSWQVIQSRCTVWLEVVVCWLRNLGAVFSADSKQALDPMGPAPNQRVRGVALRGASVFPLKQSKYPGKKSRSGHPDSPKVGFRFAFLCLRRHATPEQSLVAPDFLLVFWT